jgi:hypothetical protein
MAFDAKTNFAYALIATAPTPAASGTTFSVTAGLGAIFPAAPFNCPVWPAGANPLTTNAEVVRVTSKGTGDNWTVTRTQESSSARSIAVGDQIMLAVTAKTLTDIESQVTTDGTNIATNTASIATAVKGLIPGGRLTLTTALPVTTADVTAAGTLYYTPYIHNQVPLYDGAATWTRRTFAEISIAVPAVANQMYDVFVYDNAGTAALELLAWTNDTTRATALVKQDGRWVKTGATTRLYVGSFRTTTVVSQTEDSKSNRLVWNFYNRQRRPLARQETTASWTYTTATHRQANAAAANQVAVVIGVAEAEVDLTVRTMTSNTSAGVAAVVSIGEDSTTTPSTSGEYGYVMTQVVGQIVPSGSGRFRKFPAVGYHFYAWLEYSIATGTTTFYGTVTLGTTLAVSGLVGTVEG